jgi:hypothetical protein
MGAMVSSHCCQGGVQSEPVRDFVESRVAVVDLVHLVHREHRRNVDVLQQLEQLDVVWNRVGTAVTVDDLDDRRTVEDDDPGENLLGVALEIPDDVGLDLFAALLGDSAHEPESG